ncbi:hypothetical protein AVEN_219348-1 [Araneus ventricosus]|uniref:Uncharacterized protein n=1 Tax=Araneus ventricosus TaxID=182803 RepID=A0A4Y2BEM8_ARAVE|nr:hypothetical protein AVEN_219348-1 [Araneus ventricosus]
MIAEKNSVKILQAITCNGKLQEKCLERDCPYCSKRKIKYHTYTKNDSIKYYQWVDKKLVVEIKGKKRIANKVMKEEIETTKNGLVPAFEKQLLKFTCHACNKHQYRSMKFIKENLGTDKILLHLDFSEN